MGAVVLFCSMNARAGSDAIYSEVAEYVGVPGDILYAMAKAESGRTVEGEFKPWPWTLNVEGEARYYDTREEMFRDLMVALTEGKLRVDIGPMQVNWYWQYEKVGSPWRITEPGINIKIAAEILKSLHRGGDWRAAVGRYHRPSEALPGDRALAEAYRERVWRHLPSGGRHDE